MTETNYYIKYRGSTTVPVLSLKVKEMFVSTLPTIVFLVLIVDVSRSQGKFWSTTLYIYKCTLLIDY